MLLNCDAYRHLLDTDPNVDHYVCYGYPHNDDDLNPQHNYHYNTDLKRYDRKINS